MQLFWYKSTSRSNFIKIVFTDTSKTPKSGRHFVNKGTLLRYSLSITDYTINQDIFAFWLVLPYDLLKDRYTIDVITTKFFLLHFKMARRFENYDNILRDWAKIRYKKVLSRHCTGTRSRKNQEKAVSLLFPVFLSLCSLLFYIACVFYTK